MSRPRVATGALFFNEDGDVLLVKPTYKEGWDIPVGYVEPGETLSEACKREIREELDTDGADNGLLAIDLAPSDEDGAKVLFVFDGGVMSHNLQSRVSVQRDEP
jgi:8-oxo-dGTP diphosphatase